jgi:sulfane dehydrogenase subunit SoxC
LIGIITPSSLHFTTQHFYGIPDINPKEHKLTLHGLVERPLVFTMDDLKRFPAVSRVHFLECVGNKNVPRDKNVNDTHGRMACSEWTGVPLSVLLKEAGVKNQATWIVAEGLDGGKHTKSVPMAKVMDDVLVAYGQNGEPVRPDHGYPLRLLVPGFEGIYNVKWLRTIKVVDGPYVGFQENSRFVAPDPRSRDFIYELGPKSVITFPSGEDRLAERGFYAISGLAWSGGGTVRRVEVSTDNGRTWKDAQLQEPVLKRAFTRFHLMWKWNGEETVIQSRCIDDLGQIQPSVAEFAKFWNKSISEIHRTSGSKFGHANFIQPWKVTADGSVQNALEA